MTAGVRDFYIAAATILPILVLANGVQLNLVVRYSPEQANALERAERLVRRTIGGFMLILGVFLIYAEWVCLRSIETAHSAAGGTEVVWIALTYLGLGIVLTPIWSFLSRGADES